MKAGIQAGGPPVTWTQPIEAGCVLLNPNPELYIKPYPPINHHLLFLPHFGYSWTSRKRLHRKTVWKFNCLKFTPWRKVADASPENHRWSPLGTDSESPENHCRERFHSLPVGMMVDLNPIPGSKDFYRGNAEILGHSGWWLNQPLWKLCSSNWTSSPGIGVNIKKYLSCHHHLLDILGVLKNFYVFP